MAAAIVSSRDPVAQLARPYHETLWVLMELRDHERRDAFRQEGDRLALASLVALSFNEPKKLSDAFSDLERRAGVGAYAEATEDLKRWALEAAAASARKDEELRRRREKTEE